MQCCAFLAGMLGSGLLQRALVVTPKTLMAHWKSELGVCGLARRTYEFVSHAGAGAQAQALGSTAGGAGVLLTTYGMVQHNAPSLASHPDQDADEEPLWDLVILDEVWSGGRREGHWKPCMRMGDRASPGTTESTARHAEPVTSPHPLLVSVGLARPPSPCPLCAPSLPPGPQAEEPQDGAAAQVRLHSSPFQGGHQWNPHPGGVPEGG